MGQKQAGQLIKIQCTEKVKIVEQTQCIFPRMGGINILCLYRPQCNVKDCNIRAENRRKAIDSLDKDFN